VNLSKLCLLLLFASSCSAQVNLEWARLFNGTANSGDQGEAIAKDRFGYVYVTGYGTGTGTDWDMITVKYNPAGDSLWVRRYNGPVNNTDEAGAIAVDDSANVYVTGWSFRGSPNLYDIITIKYNSNGVQQWVQTYNGPGNNWDRAYAIVLDNAGGIYVAGYSYNSASTYTDFTTIKYSAGGAQLWAQVYNGTANSYDEAHAIEVNGSGEIYVCGFSFQSGANEDVLLVKYNSSGVQQWLRTFNSSNNGYDNANAMWLDVSGNIYLTGSGNGFGATLDMLTLKYNPGGVLQFANLYNGIGNGTDVGYALTGDNNGFYVTGYVTTGSGWDIPLFRYGLSGSFQYSSFINGAGNGNDYATSITRDNQSNVYLTGVMSVTGGGYDIAVLKYGNSAWSQLYNGPGNGDDKGNGIVVDSLYNVYVTGYTQSANRDMVTLKYSQIVGIQPNSNEIPSQFRLYQNYPNPFNPVTKIRFDIAPVETRLIASLRIYDILGREVATFVNESLKPEKYEVEWNAVNYPSGIYYCQLTAGNFAQTRKMILLK
jgi:uncharacterized delta-60 repeat protein